MKLTLRMRLIGGFLLVIITCGAIATVVGVHMMDQSIAEQARNEVRHSLSAARKMYRERLARVESAASHLAVRHFLQNALGTGRLHAEEVTSRLNEVRKREDLDTLNVTDPNGTVLLRTRNPGVTGDSQARDELIVRALARKTAVAETQIVPREELLKEGQDLAARARIRLVPTERAKPTSKTEQDSGMMLRAAAPVLDDRGELLGVVCAGKLLNGEFTLVDTIKDTLYRGERYKGRDAGTATIFQDDVRISTNVKDTEGRRAMGTRVSAEVYDHLATRDKPWVKRAFVVNDWYVTAYEPIRDVSGKMVGMLYVGMLERKFLDMKQHAPWVFFFISLGGVVLSIVMCGLLSRRLMRPIRALVLAARRLATGDLKQRVQPDESIEEIGTLGKAFNSMAASIQERDERLQERAEEQILRSEKLAMIGRLAAGVAHEINNPLGSILLFSRLLLRKAPQDGLQRENLERIAKEADRCKNIVHGLLEFARQREPKTENVNLNQVVRKPISLLEGQASFHNIEIVEDFQADLPPVSADASQLQQVFVNILVNAAEAMDGKGRLTVASRALPGAKRVEIRFSDSGCGIRPEHLPRLFEPFFTTKEVGNGTGLGLSVSHGIIQRHGGSIEVESRFGEGSTFIVSLPMAGAAVQAAREEA